MENVQYQSARKKAQYEDSVAQDLGKDVAKALIKEEARKKKKEKQREDLLRSYSYRSAYTIKRWMDDYYLDGIIGLIPGLGDSLTQLLSMPFIYISLFKVRSIPLTLAVLFNSLLDMLIGFIPVIGNIADFFFKSFKKNHDLIVGFVEDDREVIREVNKRAVWMALGIAIVSYLIYLLVSLVISLTSSIYDWVVGLFA